MPGPLEMHRRVDRRRALQQAAELGRPGVEPPPLAGGHRSIERVPQQLVTEVVLPAAMDGIQHVVVDEFLDRLVERIDRQVHDPGEDARDERPADDGARPRHGLGLGREPADPRQRRVLEGLRHVRVQDGPAVREPLPAERAAAAPRCGAGTPSVRAYTASTTSRGAGRPVPRISVVISAVSSRDRRPRRTSSASRCVTSRERHSRSTTPVRASLLR